LSRSHPRTPATRLSRRRFIETLGAGTSALLGGRRLLARGDSRPNVLFVGIDDLNDWVGALGGHPQARTPNIDALAARGTLFRNAHCSAPACAPSRGSLLTGVAPASSGLYLNYQQRRRVLPGIVTLPQHFLQNGYTTLGAGKLFHGASQAYAWDWY